MSTFDIRLRLQYIGVVTLIGYLGPVPGMSKYQLDKAITDANDILQEMGSSLVFVDVGNGRYGPMERNQLIPEVK